MKRLFAFIWLVSSIIVLTCMVAFGQNYNMSNAAVTVNCSGTEMFYDNNGAGGNYSDNQTFTKTFCTSVGNVLLFNFSQTRLRSGDVLTIYDGTTIASSIIASAQNTTTALGAIYSSGNCLTFRFVPNNNGSTREGWTAAISCVTMSPCNYMLTVIDAGCNNSGGSYYDLYYNGGYINSYWPDPWCRRNILLTGAAAGAWLSIDYIFDGTAAIDNQNSFEFRDGYGNIVASGYPGSEPTGTIINVVNYTTTCAPLGSGSYGEDCAWTPTICNDSTFNGNSSGSGGIYELSLTNTGCLFGEHQSSWYYFHAQTSGTLGLIISPINGTDDYDFAVWNTSICPPNAPPIRCSWAMSVGNTGLGNGAVDLSESSSGDGWVSTINAVAGQNFLLLVDNWTGSSSPYTVTWSLSGGASLDCAPLPVDLSSTPTIQCNGSSRTISWTTASEANTNYFILESSTEGMLWSNIATIPAAGWSNSLINYVYTDNIDYGAVVYYQIREIDYDGYQKLFGVYYSLCETVTGIVEIYPNPINEGESFIVNSKTDIASIDVVDILGREIHATFINGELSGLTSGIYFVTVNGTRTFKLIVN